MSQKNLNPLFSAQREKKGSETIEDYAYQYHWALFRAIKEHGEKREYAVFVELHEDVVLADSLDPSNASFEFNQVKTTKRNFTTNELCKIKKGASVLGKLISSAKDKPFRDKIKEINLISVNGFSLKLKEEGVDLEKIGLADLTDDVVNTLTTNMRKELGFEKLPTNLYFVIPDLAEKKFQNDVIAEISKLITTLFPGCNYNSVDIYRVLIDELNRKGMVTYDYAQWEDLLKKKALTSNTVTQLLNQFTNTKDEAKLEGEFSDIAQEMGWGVIQRKEIKKSFDRYRQQRIGNRSVAQMDLSKTLNSLIKSEISAAVPDMVSLINNVKSSLPEKIQNSFLSQADAIAAIVCEYIYQDNG